MKILSQSFYNRPTLRVAQDLLGCFLVRGAKKYKIVETEAYNGPNDLASHASIGRTERNKIMFDEPGTIYVYLTYGMHYMLNIVTEERDYPAAVLIRAVEPISRNMQHITHNTFLKTNGPAKLTKSLKIDKTFNGLPIYPIRKKSSNGASTKKHNLWIESRKEELKPSQIVRATRVGIDYAKGYKDKKWRFYIKENKFVSVQ